MAQDKPAPMQQVTAFVIYFRYNETIFAFVAGKRPCAQE
jgi:hypothetical protein